MWLISQTECLLSSQQAVEVLGGGELGEEGSMEDGEALRSCLSLVEDPACAAMVIKKVFYCHCC